MNFKSFSKMSQDLHKPKHRCSDSREGSSSSTSTSEYPELCCPAKAFGDETTDTESDRELEPDDTRFFPVETILDCKKRRGSFEYLVKWEGYGPEFNCKLGCCAIIMVQTVLTSNFNCYGMRSMGAGNSFSTTKHDSE